METGNHILQVSVHKQSMDKGILHYFFPNLCLIYYDKKQIKILYKHFFNKAVPKGINNNFF